MFVLSFTEIGPDVRLTRAGHVGGLQSGAAAD